MELFNQLIEDCPYDSISYECRGNIYILIRQNIISSKKVLGSNLWL